MQRLRIVSVLFSQLLLVSNYAHATPDFHGARFSSIPDQTAEVGQELVIPVTAWDVDDDTAANFFASHTLTGWEYDPTRESMVWIPDASQVGSYVVTLEAIADGTNWGQQNIQVDFGEPNYHPFVELPLTPSIVSEGVEFQYQATSSDLNSNDTKKFSLYRQPAGMTIDSTTGLISWTPQGGDLLDRDVLVIAEDRNRTQGQQYLRLESATGRIAPEILPVSFQSIAIGESLNISALLRQNGGQHMATFGLDDEPQGMVIGANDGVIQWTPSADQEGQYRVKINVTTQTGFNSLYFTVVAGSPVNQDWPILNAETINAIVVGETLDLQLTGSSLVAGRTLSYAVFESPEGLSVSASGLLNWTPQSTQKGTHFVDVYATDNLNFSVRQRYSITVDHSNFAPEIVTESLPIYVPGQSYSAQINVSDKNQSDDAYFYLDCAPDGASINTESGEIQWNPDSNKTGEVVFCVRVFDSHYVSSAKIFNVYIDNPNTPPRLTLEALPAAQIGEAYTYQAKVTDPDLGDSFEYKLYYPSEGMEIDSSGLFTWTPTQAQTGWHQFKIAVNNPYPFNEMDYRYFYIKVESEGVTNLPPEFISQPVTNVTAGNSYQYTAIANDPDNDPLTYTLVSAPSGLSVDSSGAVTWITSNAEVGSHLVTLQVSDGQGGIDTQSFTLVVEAVNQTPQISAMTNQTMDHGDSLAIAVIATDPNAGDILSYSLPAAPIGMVISEQGQITWAPSLSNVGSHQVIVSVADQLGLSAQTTFSVNVNEKQFAPVITSTAITAIQAGTDYTYQVVAEDPNLADVLTYTLPQSVTGMVISATGRITWLPAESDNGTHAVQVTVTDLTGLSDTQSFTITVSDVNQAPQFISESNTTSLSETAYAYQAVAVDPEGEALNYAIKSAPSGASIIEETGELSWVSTNDYVGSLLVSNTACYSETPEIGTLEPNLKWAWTGSEDEPSYNEVMMMPLSLPLLDTNNDGLTNENDIPVIVFTTYANGLYNKRGVLRAVRGDDGTELWSVIDPTLAVRAVGSIAAGDINLDGSIEIIAPTETGAIAFNSDGTLLWRNDSFTTHLETGVAIADLDSDGAVEIVVGNAVLDSAGTLIWQGTENTRIFGALPLTADINLDGYQEVIDGPNVYTHTGELLFKTTPGALAAIANIDDTPEAEVITVDSGYLRAYDHTGARIISGVAIPRGGVGGPPTVADFDGDGEPEFGTVGYYNYVVFDTDGTVLWEQDIQDVSSSRTGSSVFDFDGDGAAEVVYSDEENLRIFRGIDGALLYETPNGNGTILEYPVIVDLDLDGHAEIIASTNDFINGTSTGLRVYEDVNDSWVGTRSIWNQHAYSINNINDDGSIPTTLVNSWETHNSFRLNAMPGNHPLAAADLVVESIVYDETNQILTATILNRGTVAITDQIRVVVQQGAVNQTGEGIAVVYTDPGLAAGESVAVTVADLVSDALTQDVTVSVSSMDAQPECDSSNNDRTAALVKLTATDPLEAFDTQTFLLNVNAQNHAPSISSAAPTDVIAGKRYAYQIVVSDQDKGDSHTYELIDGPSGLIVQETSGIVTWIPALTETGDYAVTLQATDLSGATAQETFNLTVAPPNLPPVIDSEPVSSVLGGAIYQYQVDATDPENEALTFELLNGPTNLTMSATGLVQWSTEESDQGSYSVSLRVLDPLGQEHQQHYTLNVVDSSSIPQFTSLPYGYSVVGQTYRHTFTATDPNNAGLTFEFLDGESAASFESTGAFAWSPTDLGVYTFRIAVEDGIGARNTRSFSINVTGVGQANRYPDIHSVPLYDGVVGYEYRYQVDASDPDGDTLNYQTVEAPTGMSIDNQGLVTWTPTIDQLGTNEVALWVDDGQAYTEQRYSVVVQQGITPLTVDVFIEPKVVDAGGEVTITVQPQGGLGEKQITVLVDNAQLTLDENNQTITSSMITGRHNIQVNVVDDQLETDVTDYYTVRNGDDSIAPIATIHTPSNLERVTQLIDVSATATDDNLAEYRLIMSPVGQNQWQTLATGQTNITHQTVAQFDPTQLTNGLYDLVLEAVDTNDQITKDHKVLLVEGDLKLGNFSITLEELNIPLSGIPIRVTRTYDSRRRNEDLDFGFGWSIGYQDIKVEESRIPGSYWVLNQYPRANGLIIDYCVEPQSPVMVTITLPTGEVEAFEMKANPHCQAAVHMMDVFVQFEPADENTTSKLEVLEYTSVVRVTHGRLEDLGEGQPINPDRYRLTTRNGYIYTLDQDFGIRTIEEPNGNTITYTDDGIFHSSGKAVTFNRDSLGRITHVIDPNGNELEYRYDFNGNLINNDDTLDNTTNYTYISDHYLDEIIDPLGRTYLKNIYDENGRLTAQQDNLGNTTTYDHDLVGRQSTVTDKRGNISFYYYDQEGNVTSMVNALNETTLYTYDARGNRLTETNHLGETITATYDENRYQTSQTDALGNTVHFTYNDRGQETTVTDVRGNVITNIYDTKGNIIEIQDPIGNFAYNWIGAGGNPFRTYDLAGIRVDSGWDEFGNKTAEVDPLRVRHTFTYDDNGNQLTEEHPRTLADGSEVIETTHYTYDARNRLTATEYEDGTTTSAEYDVMGNQVASVDAHGRRTVMVYDIFGRLTETQYPDGTTESKTYDEEGNLLTDTDRLGRTTAYTYDALNRQTRVTYSDNTYSDTVYDSAGRVIEETNARGFTTSFEYDAAGRRTAVEDALGNRHIYGYDDDGNLTSETDANGNSTSYTYNELDQKVLTTFADGSTMSDTYDAISRRIRGTDQAGNAVQFGYDDKSQLVSVTNALNGETTFTYDEAGNKLTQTDANGNTTTWTYDSQGRVLTRVLPLGQSESYTYDVAGNLQTHTDFNGQLTTYTYDINQQVTQIEYADGLIETFTYDALGNQLTAAGADGTTSYEYDVLNRLSVETQPGNVSISYTYDANGNRTSVITDTNGTIQVTDYAYDALNRLVQVTDSNNGITTYTYDAVGNRETVTQANGQVTTYSYDVLNRLTHELVTNAASQVIAEYAYTLDETGRRTEVEELHQDRVAGYGYDKLYRLTQETVSDVINGDYHASYQYDAVGNRTYSIVDGVHTAFAYDDNDRLTQQGGVHYTYDGNGNTLTESEDSNITTYTYNAKNNLTSVQVEVGADVSTTDYTYNVAGIRTSKTDDGVETRYVVDSNRDYAQVLVELDTNDAIQAAYTYGDDLLSQQRDGASFYYVYDGHGSTRALTDSSAAVTDTYDYDAFGVLLASTGSTDNNYRYTGEQYDSTLDQYYLRARYYDQGVGRFTQMDTWMGHNSDPETLHKYMYTHADPVNNTDPTGNYTLSGLSTALNIRGILTVASRTHAGMSWMDTIINGDPANFDARAFGASIIISMLGGKLAEKFLGVISKKFKSKKSTNEKDVEDRPPGCIGNSFIEGTLVYTENGLVPIEEIEIGDMVWAYDEESNTRHLQEVVYLIEGSGIKKIVDITLVNGDVIRATDGHPLYVLRKTLPWINAGDVNKADLLMGYGGEYLEVSRVASNSENTTVYNLTVEHDHTFFVGNSKALAHNCSPNFVSKIDGTRGLLHSFDRHAVEWFGGKITKETHFSRWQALLTKADRSNLVFHWKVGSTPSYAKLAKIEGKSFVVQYYRSGPRKGEILTAFVPSQKQMKEIKEILFK